MAQDDLDNHTDPFDAGGPAAVCAPPRTNVVSAIRGSLNAKRERLLERPIIARIVESPPEPEPDRDDAPSAFRALERAAREFSPKGGKSQADQTWEEDPEDGTWSVRIALDYDTTWRGHEREIRNAVEGIIEDSVTFLTDEQKRLLEQSPKEFLGLEPRPETAELVSFQLETIGGSDRVVELRLAARPKSPDSIHHMAIVPNLVQIERQLAGLWEVEHATDDGALGPLRALVGLCNPPPSRPAVVVPEISPGLDENLDEHQAECIRKAMLTPHFSVIQGPPGSGKTTVIAGIVRRVLEQGERVLVVSPTHVAVDNVVERLVPRPSSENEDQFEKRSLPIRYAAKKKKLSERALEYWVGRKRRHRKSTIARRLQERLSEAVPFAQALFAMEDTEDPGAPPLSAALDSVDAVICGTPIGILSFDPVKDAAPGAFGLLIVDEVSKMTMPEFLAIAVKARRWVLVGDPEQLPPYNDAEENATTLDAVLDPLLELVCSVGAVVERARPFERKDLRVVVVSSEPERVAWAISAHLEALMPENHPSVRVLGEQGYGGIVVCSVEQTDAACEALSPVRGRDRTHNPQRTGTVEILVERGLELATPEFANGQHLVEVRDRSQARLYDTAFNVYHAQPWERRDGQQLRIVRFRKGLDKYLPSAAALEKLHPGDDSPVETRAQLVEAIAERFAVNAVSVYDWIAGIPTNHFDVSPLRELEGIAPLSLSEAVRPFVGTLKRQYRMHPSLSVVPRELFYFGDALHDGKPEEKPGCRIRLVQCASDDRAESNASEAKAICKLLDVLNADEVARGHRQAIMVITPYRAQEALLNEYVDELRVRGKADNLDIEVCTLDRCQGKEAEYVLISLVRSRATNFFDMPKRWNVALTRAKAGLFLVGNIDAYLEEAKRTRKQAHLDGPQMSLLARIIEEYDRHLAEIWESPS